MRALCGAACGTLCCSLGGYQQAALARDPVDIPSWVQLDAELPVDRETFEAHWSTLVRTPDSRPDYSLASGIGPASGWATVGRSAGFIEVPQGLAAAQPQAYARPQFALGSQSDLLRSWMRLAGINAAACLAPVMRMHSGVAGGSTRATVSVSARCSLH